jgi:hypothetical protein
MDNTRAAAIRDLNDRFRSGFPAGDGRALLTAGVQALLSGDAAKTAALIDAVRRFDAFDSGNDPFREHDFGAFAFAGEKLFWKIDCYAPDLEHGSQDPADPAKTVRVITVMLAEEY